MMRLRVDTVLVALLFVVVVLFGVFTLRDRITSWLGNRDPGPPKVLASDPARGPANAAVTIIEVGDFACPFCEASQPALAAVLAKYRDQVRHVWKDLPLPDHPEALPAAIAARCAQEQGKFWEMHDKLFAPNSKLADGYYRSAAAELGLDKDAFASCLTSDRPRTLVEQSFNHVAAAGVDGTPYFFINTIRITEQPSSSLLERAVLEARAQ